MCAAKDHVRFAPESGHARRTSRCLLWAKSGHHVYSITSSARVSREAGIVMPSVLAVFILITVSNLVVYVMGDIPVGAYDSMRLSNLGIGHGAVDAGVGYTYFDQKTGLEFSAVTGLTYNFINPSTNYQNGVDWHLDWAASQFLSQQFSLGVVGYIYKEIGCDSGSGDRVGCFQSQVFGVGPQVTYLFPVGNMQGYLNLKAYKEFDAQNRPDGWNAWLTFAISPAAPTAKRSASPRMVTK
jgi:hypothetical protein